MLTDEQIAAIVEGQTDVSYQANGDWVVRRQMAHAIRQALELNEGRTIRLPKGTVMEVKS